MFLKRLEISGFKSFAAKTALDFSYSQSGKKGVTTIVGPNGSGKSNIADAVRWALGEQSMKNLRGKKSEDVIFAGTGKKARLGSAQVTLYFDNTDKRIPIEFTEVSITRKVFRSGEGEYQINGSRVRLQDIVDLLAKAGIGKESYCIINQGMADAVLNASPLERRSIIEDAAGVKHYQIKKERSIRKLELTRENLDKVRSIIEEIKPHLRNLKRQAEKASQSENIFKELKEKQIQLFTYLWHNFQNERRKLGEDKEEIGRKMMNIQREVDKLSDAIAKEAKEEEQNRLLSELEKKRNDKKRRLNQLERELVITEGRIEIEKEKQQSWKVLAEIKSIPVDLEYIKNNLESIRADQKKLIERISRVEKIEELQEIKEFARVIQQRLHDLKVDIEKGHKENISPASGEIISPKNEEENVAITHLENQLASIQEKIAGLEKEINELEENIAEEIKKEKKKRYQFFEIEKNLRFKQEELGILKDKFNESKIALARVEVREEDLRAQVEKELKISVDELKGEVIDINQEIFEHDINRLKIQMEKVGGIDPMVIEEYEETKKRFEFLTQESEDLKKAISALKEVIKEMEQKINETFDTTFEEINKEFTKYFRIIFGGGNAHLSKVKIKSRSIKIKEEDINNTAENLESISNEENESKAEEEIGIDIFACPPGKRITNMSMLSGGERSLTSLALLFSIISHNPPPFAVLDEVEAALDEANSRRFGRIISELSNQTQFIIITHNRETMRNASLLYGVTMTEDGISKLLSVRLDQVGQGGKIMKEEK